MGQHARRGRRACAGGGAHSLGPERPVVGAGDLPQEVLSGALQVRVTAAEPPDHVGGGVAEPLVGRELDGPPGYLRLPATDQLVHRRDRRGDAVAG